jgi:hypothetical protein
MTNTETSYVWDPDLTDPRSPVELEARRREITDLLKTQYKGYNDPEVPFPLLQELSVITSTLRRKNAGPPREPRRAAVKPQAATIDDLLA